MNQLFTNKFSSGCGIATILLAVICLTGFYTNNLLIAAFSTNLIMMAPSTGVCFCLLGIALLGQISWRRNSKYFALLIILIVIPTAISTFELISFVAGIDSMVDRFFTDTTDRLGTIPIGRMSPITAALFLFAGFSLLLEKDWPQSYRGFLYNCASTLIVLVLVTGFIIIIGYWYTVPFFYNGSIVPPALPTAICFFVLGLGIFHSIARKSSLFRVLFGDSVFARLVRNMVPLIGLFILFEGWTDSVNFQLFTNQAINQLFLTFMLIVLIITVIASVSQKTSLQLAIASAETKANETLFSTIFTVSPGLMAISKMSDNRVIKVNQLFLDSLGFTVDEVIGKTSQDAGLLFDPQERIRAMQDIMKHGRLKGFEMRLKKKDGSTIDVLASSEILHIGNEDCILTSAVDITERKHAEKKLLQTNEKLQIAQRLSKLGSWEWILATNTMVWSEELCSIYGHDPKLSVPHFTEMSSLYTSESWNRLNEAVTRAISSGESYELELDLIRTDQTVLKTISRGEVDYGANGKITGLHGTVQDITELKRMEEALLNTQRLESLGLLAGGIAHDFNNLLGGIFGNIDLAFEEIKEKKVQDYLEKALSTVERARALTGQLLTFAKGGAPIKKLHHLTPFIEDTVRFALSGSNVKYRCIIPDPVWQCEYDKNQVGQVIDNIVINAQQAMPEGGTIEITANNFQLTEKYHPILPPGNYVTIAIKDNGIGMPKEIIPKIFNPFFTTKTKGHGLGLTTCFSIIKRHGGWIDVESEPGKGSLFIIYIPASPDTATVDTPINSSVHHGSGSILLMDDEDVMRDTLSSMLKTMGYKIFCTTNSTEALEEFDRRNREKEPFTMVILDLTIPGELGGKETVRLIKKIDKHTPVFVASGYTEDPVMSNPTEYGFTGSIYKPFRKTELAELLNKHIKISN